MDPKEYRTLKLLETIDGAQSPPSQRDLAKTLDMSLGLVNAFLRRLAKKGYFEVRHLPRNRIGYILTPTGVAEKSRLTYAYVLASYRYYKAARAKFQVVFDALENHGLRRLAFFGAGELAEIGVASLQGTGIQLAGIFDPKNAGCTFMGYTVLGLSEFGKVHFDRLLVTTNNDPKAAAQCLGPLGIGKDRILFL